MQAVSTQAMHLGPLAGLASFICAHHSQLFRRKIAGLTCRNDEGVLRGSIHKVHRDPHKRIVAVAGRDEIVFAASTEITQQCMLSLSGLGTTIGVWRR